MLWDVAYPATLQMKSAPCLGNSPGMQSLAIRVPLARLRHLCIFGETETDVLVAFVLEEPSVHVGVAGEGFRFRRLTDLADAMR